MQLYLKHLAQDLERGIPGTFLTGGLCTCVLCLQALFPDIHMTNSDLYIFTQMWSSQMQDAPSALSKCVCV